MTHWPPGYPDRVQPAESPVVPPWSGRRPQVPARRPSAVLRRHVARALLRSSMSLRSAADALTRLRWRVEDTARNRAVVEDGYAQGRADLQLIHTRKDT